ncbi:dethiobiotin synthase [Actinomadura sp. ATCC 31491]|uniref:ATP-dependent dethiobiotin synthetase BioD n=1 Tax=Actinomadura luzonensis TaxID=2805427 RepID=A0ABT0FLL6_9ACTN|nr:dethiobiotin synthase [Actinomadura luzonensis]MCK2212940.1 dethiobiotin synthase [Actinomadura luzonensis]
MSVLVVAGTGVAVGKTVVTAAVAALALSRGAAVAVVKPAQTGRAPGEPGDLDEVRRLSGARTTFELARFAEPLSPAAAARVAGLPPVSVPSVALLVRELAESNRLVLVEGGGGLLERYDEDGATIADLARLLSAQVLLVTGAGREAVNQAALTLEALAHRGLGLAGLVIGRWPAEPGAAGRCAVADLEMLAARPLAGALPDGAGALAKAAFAEVARRGLGPTLGGAFDPSAFRHEVLGGWG